METGSVYSAPGRLDVAAGLRLVQKFNEREPDSFFTLFERVAHVRSWSDEDKVLMLQYVLTGRAQKAYSAICAEDVNYDMIKAAMLKAYKLVPEAYRQKFRTWVKGDEQTNVEFVRDLSSHFHH